MYSIPHASAADFTLSASQTGLQIPSGSSASVTITVTGGGPVSLTTSVCYGGTHLQTSFNPSVINPSGGSATSTLTIGPMPSSGGCAGLFYITVIGNDGSGQQTVVITVSLGPSQPDFKVQCCFSTGDGNVTVSEGTTYSSWGWVTSLNSYIGSVTLSISLDLQASFNPSTVTLSSGQTVEPAFTIIVPFNAPTGNHYGSITGTDGSLTHTIPLKVNVKPPPPDYTVSVSPASLVITQGSLAVTTVTLTSLYGFAATVYCPSYWGNIDVKASTPLGLTASAGASCLTLNSGGTNTTSLTVSAGLQTVPGNYSVTVIASFQVSPSGWTTSRTATLSVTVKARGDVNGDGKVDISDLAMVGVAFGSIPTSPRWNPNADFDHDGVIDINDLTIVASNFGYGT